MDAHIPKDDRSKLVDAARALIAQGNGKFSIAALCACAGVERTVFRAYFPGRAELMAALDGAGVVQPDILRTEAECDAMAVEAAPVSAAARTDAWLERRLRVFERALMALEARAEAMQREHGFAMARMEERMRAVMGEQAAADVMADMAASGDQTLRVANGGTVTVQAIMRPDLEAAISAAPSADPDIPALSAMAVQTAQPQVTASQVALVLPVEMPPQEKAVPREEMSELLKGARQAARASIQDDAPQMKPRRKLRLPWLVLGCLSLVGLFIGLGLTLGEPARAVQMSSGSGVAYRHVSHDAFQRMIALADNGDAKAEAGLALAYLRGEKMPADPRAAMHWAGQAAKAGNPIGQYLMGTFYHQGEVVKADPAVAIRWFVAAAERGNLKAMHNLAIAYAEGLGTPRDAAKAALWFRRAAERGYVDSAFDLAVLYERGDGVPQNPVQALKWYDIAAATGDAPSQARADFLRHQLGHRQIALADADVRGFESLTPLPAANRLPEF